MNGAILSSYYEIVKFILSLIRILHIYDVDQLFRTHFFRDNAGIRDKINAFDKFCIPAMNIGRSQGETITNLSLI